MATLRAMPEKVIVTDMHQGERIINGIILLNDNGKDHGIRARWARVVSAGERAYGIAPDQWVLVAHGRWTRPFMLDLDDSGTPKKYYEVDKDSLLMVADQAPKDDIVKDSFVQGTGL